MMTARNDFVKEGLRRNYTGKVPGGFLEVFCVSNLIYEKSSKMGAVDQVNASGIPELRRFCHTITAKPQYFEAKNFLLSSLSSLLTSIRLWAEKNQESTDPLDESAKQEVFEAFEGMSLDVRNAIKGTEECFLNSFQEQLLRLMENRNHHWERTAEQNSNEWNQVRFHMLPHRRISPSVLSGSSGTQANTTPGATTMAPTRPKNVASFAGTLRSSGR